MLIAIYIYIYPKRHTCRWIMLLDYCFISGRRALFRFKSIVRMVDLMLSL
jgi:hypothetical protein